MITILASTAFGATYSAEIAIPEDHPSVNLGHIPATKSFGMRRALTLQKSAPDQTASTGDSRIHCGVEDGWVFVSFEATASNWPSTFPVTTSCTNGSDTLNISVVKMSAETDISKQNGTLVSNTATFTKVEDSSVMYSYRLPAGNYQTGLFNSTLPGVKCRVVNVGGYHVVSVRSSASATSGAGTCTLPQPGPNYTLNLDITEKPI